MHFLVTFATTDGQTGEIADRIGQRLRAAGHEADVRDIANLPNSLQVTSYDAVMVGGSIHAQGYQWRLKRFLARNREALASRPSAFFSVCLAIASAQEDERTAAHAIPRRFVEGLHWSPDAVEVIAGALRFSKYGLVRRMMMKAIAAKEMGTEIDTTQDHVLTDWDQVDAFASTFAEFTQSRVARGQPRRPAGVPAS